MIFITSYYDNYFGLNPPYCAVLYYFAFEYSNLTY